jgi:transposase
MIEHLKLISQATPKGRHALIIMDNAGWHTTKAINCFDNITIMRLPPYSPELNPVEQFWQQIKQRYLSNLVFKNYDDIVGKSCNAWNKLINKKNFVKNLCSRDWALLV